MASGASRISAHNQEEAVRLSKRKQEEEEAMLSMPNYNHNQEEAIPDASLTSNNDGPRLIRAVMDRSLFVPLMHIADGAASSAGSQLMSECIYSHMPLLALYLEQDDEQRLNVELGRHTGAFHKSQVFGTSFESLTIGLKGMNHTTSNSPTLEELKKFVQEVKSSRVIEVRTRLLSPSQTTSSCRVLAAMKIPFMVSRMPPPLSWKSSSKFQKVSRLLAIRL
jgi:hypothetical protein